jgi:hypothetical protein
MKCQAGREYQRSLSKRFEEEAQTLAKLTDWKIQDIRKKINVTQVQPSTWWQDVWKSFTKLVQN